jgi:hypothetical protein
MVREREETLPVVDDGAQVLGDTLPHGKRPQREASEDVSGHLFGEEIHGSGWICICLLACLRDHLLRSGFGVVVDLGFHLSVRRTKKIHIHLGKIIYQFGKKITKFVA